MRTDINPITGEETQVEEITVSCTTEECGNAGIEFTVAAGTVQCGVCQEWIIPPPEPEPDPEP